MKNKGRKHLATSGNAKGCLVGITIPVGKMGRRKRSYISKKQRKKWWRKRVRGYLKTRKGKEIFLQEEI